MNSFFVFMSSFLFVLSLHDFTLYWSFFLLQLLLLAHQLLRSLEVFCSHSFSLIQESYYVFGFDLSTVEKSYLYVYLLVKELIMIPKALDMNEPNYECSLHMSSWYLIGTASEITTFICNFPMAHSFQHIFRQIFN